MRGSWNESALRLDLVERMLVRTGERGVLFFFVVSGADARVSGVVAVNAGVAKVCSPPPSFITSVRLFRLEASLSLLNPPTLQGAVRGGGEVTTSALSVGLFDPSPHCFVILLFPPSCLLETLQCREVELLRRFRAFNGGAASLDVSGFE
jgi:hypothetical protein